MAVTLDVLFKVNDGEATSAIDRVIKKIEEIGKRSQAAASTKVGDIIPESSLRSLALKMPKGSLMPDSVVKNLSSTLGSLKSSVINDIEFELNEVLTASRKATLNADEKKALQELEDAAERLRRTRAVMKNSMVLEASQLDTLSTVFSKVTGKNVSGLSAQELLSGIGNSLEQFDSGSQDILKTRIGLLNDALEEFKASPSPTTRQKVNTTLGNLVQAYDEVAVREISKRTAALEAGAAPETKSKPLTSEGSKRTGPPGTGGTSANPASAAAAETLRLALGDFSKGFNVDEAIQAIRVLGTSKKNLKQASEFLSSVVSKIEQEVSKAPIGEDVKADFAQKLDLLRVELANFYNKAKTGVVETTAEVKAEAAAVEEKPKEVAKKPRGASKRKLSKSVEKVSVEATAVAGEVVEAVAPTVSPEVVEKVKSTRGRARRALTEAELAEQEIGNSLKTYAAFFNNITSILKNTTRAANIEAGGITSPATFSRQLQVYSREINTFLTSANDFFNSFSLGGKQLKPGEFLSKVNIPGLSRITDIQARNQKIGTTVSGISSQFGLDPVQRAAFEKTLAASLAELASRYTALSRSASVLNEENLKLAKAEANTLAQQNEYESALETLKRVTLTAVRRNKDGTFGTETMALGDIGFDVKSLTGFGLSRKQALAIIKQQKQLEGEIAKLEDIRRQKPQGGGIGGFNLPGFARFAGQALTAFSFLQFTIGTAVQTLTQFVDQANRLEKASATVSALSGNFTKYTQVLNIAQVQQAKFGGTLEEQLQGLSSLVPISKRYNVSLEQLDNIARRLAIIDPLQGFSGASIALKEFFSGDITSLSRRFEIDRKTLNSIKDAGDRAEQLQELDRVLSQLGISQAVLEARTNTAAASFDRASAAWNNYTTLLGQQTQTVLKPAADGIADAFAFAGEELEKNLANSQKFQEIAVNLRRVSNESMLLKRSIDEINFDGFISNGDSVLNRLETDSVTTTREIINLRDAINTVLIDLNKIRESNGETPFALLTSDTKTAREEVYKLGIAFKNLPIESIIKVLTLRGEDKPWWSLESGQAQTQGLNFLNNYFETLKLLPNFEQMSGSERITKRTDFRGAFEETKLSDLDKIAAAEYSSQFLEIVKDEAFGSKAKQFVSQNARLFSGDQFKNLTDRDKVIQYFTVLYEDVASGAKSVNDLGNEFNRLAETQIPVIKNTQVIINGIYDITDQLNKIEEPSKNLENATNLYNESLSVTKKFATDLYNAEMKNLALRYVAADLAEKNLISQDIRSRKLLQTNEEITATESMKLRAIYNADRAQAQFVLNQNKSVSAVQALNSLYGQLNISLEEAAKLAVEFSSSLSGITTGTLLPNLSLQDQLSFNRMALMGQVPGLAPQNQTDATNLLGTIFGNVLQLGEESSKTGESRAKRLADLEEKYIEDKRKAEEDYEKDRTRMAEEYEKRRKELLRESEVGKRESRSGFYRSLMGTEGLTDEQMQQAAADYERLFQQASELRNQGEFQKAQALLSTGVEEILNRIQVQEDIAAEKQNIIDADEEIADLQKDLAKAKEQDDRAEIQRKIAKANQDKLDAENRIKQIEGVAKLQEDTDAQKIKDAKTLEETITTNYETELANRKKEYDEKLLEMETEYKKAVKNMSEADNTRAKKQLVNIMDLLMIQDYANSVMQQAQAELTYGPGSSQATAAKAIAEANRTATKIYFDNTGSVLAKDFETYANLIENQLQASDIQSGGGAKTPAKSPTILATEDNTDATKLNTLAVQRLNQILSGPNKALYRIPE